MDGQEKPILVVGAGLAGSLLATYLAQQGFQVEVFEKQVDMRKIDYGGGRSINLALSTRGIRALKEVGVLDQVMEIAIPMKGRTMHAVSGELTYQPYGKDPEREYINSVSRAELNKILMSKAEESGNVKIHFNHDCQGINLETGEVIFVHDGKTLTSTAQTVFATDGAGSNIRYSLQRTPRFNFSQYFLEHGYKELTIPPNADGSHKIAVNTLHIWPRGSHMMIALPNPDGSFTATLFHPYEGMNGFDTINTGSKAHQFFQENYPDVLEHMPKLVEEYDANPVGILGTIRCNPWYYSDKVLLLGDASHAIVPFYGQGMNAAFEDCRVLNDLINEHGNDWKLVFPKFNNLRKVNADAIADLALDNFVEMRDRVADERFLLLKKAELLLYEKYPEITSKYSMVTFSHIPYAEALQKGEILTQVLQEQISTISSLDEFNDTQAYNEIMRRYDALST